VIVTNTLRSYLKKQLVVLVVCSGVNASGDLTGIQTNKLIGTETGGAVLDVGRPGAFDAVWVTCPSVLFDGTRYVMWYSSFYDSHMGKGGIGIAISADGIHWTRSNGGKPVLTIGPRGGFDDGQVMGPQVLLEHGMYRMWYTGMSSHWHSSGIGFYRVGLATSTDGVHWTRANHGRPVLDVGPRGAFDEVQAATPSILHENGEYRMWYAAWSPGTGHTICVARSRDGIYWRREERGQPVTGLSEGGAYGPTVSRVGSEYLMLYMRAAGNTRGLNAVTSLEGRTWQSLSDEPVVKPGQWPAFDSALAGHASLLETADRTLLWYTGYRREEGGQYGWKLRIGMAELQLKGPRQ
jgi:predicted GH43/DUF377 family glycosyl hydrolase